MTDSEVETPVAAVAVPAHPLRTGALVAVLVVSYVALRWWATFHTSASPFGTAPLADWSPLAVEVLVHLPLFLAVLVVARSPARRVGAALVVVALVLLQPFPLGPGDNEPITVSLTHLRQHAELLRWHPDPSDYLRSAWPPALAALAWAVARRRPAAWPFGVLVAGLLGAGILWLATQVLDPFALTPWDRRYSALVALAAVAGGLASWWVERRAAR